MLFLILYSSIGIKPDAASRRESWQEEAETLITMGLSKKTE